MSTNQNLMQHMRELIDRIKAADVAYYRDDNPTMTDREYDLLVDELKELEITTGLILSGSPTQTVSGEILKELTPVRHTKPMLSADKTKSVDEMLQFANGRPVVLSWKLDGLTLVLRYEGGEFKQAITRGREGIIGEDVTHTVRTFMNVPMCIPCTDKFEVRGEGVISWAHFEKINLSLSEPYSHPRNLAAGSVRMLDARESGKRYLEFFAFDLISDSIEEQSKATQLQFLAENGFDVVPYVYTDTHDADELRELITDFKPAEYGYPVDGVIMEYDNLVYGRSLGATGHHENRLMALKWEDELYETECTGLDVAVTRTGMVSLTATFKPVEIDGTMVSRAYVHNFTIYKNLALGIGDKLMVYKANKIIPQIAENLTRNGDKLFTVPDKCPICGGHVKITGENETEELQCMNLECKGKLLGELCTFVSKEAHDITGLSKSTLSLLIEKEFIKGPLDLFYLKDCRGMLVTLQGLGAKKVDKILESIEKCRKTTLPKFLYGLSIPLIGRSVSKQLNIVEEKRAREKGLKTAFDSFIKDMDSQYDFTCLEDFGFAKASSLKNYFEENQRYITELAAEFQFEEVSQETVKDGLNGAIFCITGTLTEFANRAALVEKIESLGGKVTGSVTKKTNYLINNDTLSKSSKNVKAMQLGVPIISEKEFLNKFIKKC